MNTESIDTELDSYDCYNLTMETKVLRFAVNEDKRKRRYYSKS